MIPLESSRRSAGPRTIAIGDIHGHVAPLRTLLGAIQPRASDTIVFLGDYIDRGPDSKGVVDLVLDLETRCIVIPLMGNHEEMLLGALDSQSGQQFWLKFGGEEALRSYGMDRPQRIPDRHIEFVKRCRRFHEDAGQIYAHANYWPNRHMADQLTTSLFWEDLDPAKAAPHFSRKTVIVGHTPQRNSWPLDLGFLVCIDTGCGFGGRLTALEVATRQVWQADEQGRLIDQSTLPYPVPPATGPAGADARIQPRPANSEYP